MLWSGRLLRETAKCPPLLTGHCEQLSPSVGDLHPPSRAIRGDRKPRKHRCGSGACARDGEARRAGSGFIGEQRGAFATGTHRTVAPVLRVSTDPLITRVRTRLNPLCKNSSQHIFIRLMPMSALGRKRTLGREASKRLVQLLETSDELSSGRSDKDAVQRWQKADVELGRLPDRRLGSATGDTCTVENESAGEPCWIRTSDLLIKRQRYTHDVFAS